MAAIGILGEIDCGKTSCFRTFSKILEQFGDRIIKSVPGGGPMDFGDKITTNTVDFLRFTYQGFIHVLYGTGGHKNPSTTYYRDWVLRNADRFLCMIDLSMELEKQLKFFELCSISTRSVVMVFNKYDLNQENFLIYKDKVLEFFRTKFKILLPEYFATVAIDLTDATNQYGEFRMNCYRAVISLCSLEKTFGSIF